MIEWNIDVAWSVRAKPCCKQYDDKTAISTCNPATHQKLHSKTLYHVAWQKHANNCEWKRKACNASPSCNAKTTMLKESHFKTSRNPKKQCKLLVACPTLGNTDTNSIEFLKIWSSNLSWVQTWQVSSDVNEPASWHNTTLGKLEIRALMLSMISCCAAIGISFMAGAKPRESCSPNAKSQRQQTSPR